LNLLLDTHILLWWLANDARAAKAIETSNLTFVSAATAWEIGIKSALKKLDFRGDLESQLILNDFLLLPVTIAHAVAASRLPSHHNDPFDRMLVAQSSLEALTLVTADKRLAAYRTEVMLVRSR
jgi:PIN domain nuclease of toxin-antitoxin system